MNPHKTILILVTVFGLGVLSLTAVPLSAMPPVLAGSASSSDLWSRTELFFGSEKPDGSSVSENQFRSFVDLFVTPRFPDGLTLLTGYGQYKGESGKIVKERSFMLVLLYQDKAANEKLEAIRLAYKRAFKQESVLRVDDTARVSF